MLEELQMSPVRPNWSALANSKIRAVIQNNTELSSNQITIIVESPMVPPRNL